ncbi:hypothetical protein BKA65DRAFT_390619 [Rhexocercosporidium sp. MPI-PUGE-AT-0058]|nr:hypothetical protein BKA65DRAFT_390619 [Rhexocercosporidium sp. MPI-PUGE-AT-0058]
MPPPNIKLHLATEDDASSLASIMTAAFSSSDAAYPLIWGSAAQGTHDMMSIVGLFTPVQKPDRVTYKAVDEKSKKVIGFATWTLPKENLEIEEGREERGVGGLPKLPGVNVDLWMDKYQRQGIASSLLEIGSRVADARRARFWCTSTPQAVGTYEKNGWRILETHDVDLGNYGGDGVYTRAWMVREPKGDRGFAGLVS